LLLECAYEALENAGVPKESVSGKKVGVFVGGNYSEHRVANLRDLDHIPVFDATGNQGAFLAGRLAYYFNLRGPTFTVDTACSSSMHALHLAVQSIRAGESEQAIVGASHLITDPDIWVSMAKLHLFSDEGKTYAFDDRAKSGYARGEGAGCLILKPLAQAQADNDHIFSVITHSGINHNGRTVGIVAPSPDEQESLLKRVFAEANINPCDIGFFEAHGTGTKKGDPIEAQAIHRAVGRHFTRQDPLHIGSVKANIGHLECASGVVSVIKGVLMLYYGFILPNADFERVNEAIPMDEYNMRVATAQKPWPAKRKYVCVNNFGFSGSNSTCVLSAAPQLRGLEVADSGNYSPLRLFVISANDEPALRKSITKLGVWIEQHAELYQTTMPRNLSYTLCQRRSHLPWRVAVVASMCSEVASALNSHEAVPVRAPSEPPRLTFVYTGQGAQWYAMGRELLRTHPVFRDAVNRADETLRAIGADFSLLEELQRDQESSRVGLAHISQAVCSAVQLALTDLFASWGVRPAAVTGHSSGEIAAAYAAGALTFESAVAAAYYRGQVIVELQENYPNLRGSMMAVGAGAEKLDPMLSELNKNGGPQVVVACENSPSSTTLSGDEEAIDRVAAMFEEKGVFNRKLFVNVAYHSPHMKLLASSYLKSVSHIEAPSGMASSEVKFFSSLHGRRISLEELGPQYWVDNLTQTVRFASALKSLCTDKEFCPDILIEIGPAAALKGPIMQNLKTLGPAANKISYLPSLVRGENATRTCLHTAGQLFVRGCRVNFFEINHHREEAEQPELVPSLYTYPWSRQSYWYESRIVHQHRVKPFARNDLLGALADWSAALQPTWRNIIRTEDLPWLKDYVVQSRMVFPVAAFISTIMEAAVQTAMSHGLDPRRFQFDIRNFAISDHLFLDEGKEYEMLLTFHYLKAKDTREHAFHISSYEAGRGWLEHCTGTVTATDVQDWSGSLTSADDTAGVQEEALNGCAHESSTSLEDVSSDSLTTRSNSFSEGSSAGNGMNTPDTLESLANSLPGPSSDLEPLVSSPADVYQRLASRNVSYPESFRSMGGIMANDTKLVAQGVMQDTAAQMPKQHESRYEIHPSLIDSMLQLPLLRLQGESDNTETAYLPSSVSHIILRPQPESKWKAGAKFGVVAAAEPRRTTFMAELLPTSESASPEAVVSMAGIEYKALESATREAAQPRELCYDVTWEPLKAADFSEIEKTVRERGRAGVTIVTRNEAHRYDPLVIYLAREIEAHVGVSPHICPFGWVKNFSGFFIVMWEAQTPRLILSNPGVIKQTRNLLTKPPGLMWVTQGATRYTHAPEGNLALGLVRTARSERSAVASTLDLSPKSKLTAPQQAALIKDAFVLSVLSDNEAAEMEFAEVAGELAVPRIVPDERLNLEVHRALGPSAPYEQDFRRPGRRLSLASISAEGSSDELYFEDVPDTALADDEVEVEVVASALSLQDGIAPWTPDKSKRVVPRSCSGYVTRRVGKDGKVTNLAKEERVPVCVLTEAPLGTHVRARATSVAEIPKSVDMKTAAYIPGPFLAAYHALTKVAVVRENERVLVQLSGPAGVAGLVVAKWLGAKVFALVQNQLQEGVAVKYGVPPERILHARSIYLRGQLEEATQGNGMDVVLALSGHAGARAWECLGNFGRFVEVRTPGEHARTKPELGVNATFTSVNMNSIAVERPSLLKETLEAVVRVIENGAITPPAVGSVVPVSELANGLRRVREGAVESVVVTLSCENQQVKVSGHHQGRVELTLGGSEADTWSRLCTRSPNPFSVPTALTSSSAARAALVGLWPSTWLTMEHAALCCSPGATGPTTRSSACKTRPPAAEPA
jgi:acyl transferase domain-containing protein/NADPH:quinone reductase-like Zn-dependent oxidoreductase